MTDDARAAALQSQLDARGWRALLSSLLAALAVRVGQCKDRVKYFVAIPGVLRRCIGWSVNAAAVETERRRWLDNKWEWQRRELEVHEAWRKIEAAEHVLALRSEMCSTRLEGRVDIESKVAQRCLADLTRAKLRLAEQNPEWRQRELDMIADWSNRAAFWDRIHREQEREWEAWTKNLDAAKLPEWFANPQAVSSTAHCPNIGAKIKSAAAGGTANRRPPPALGFGRTPMAQCRALQKNERKRRKNFGS